jgi:hypothetical protein
VLHRDTVCCLNVPKEPKDSKLKLQLNRFDDGVNYKYSPSLDRGMKEVIQNAT